MRDDHTTSPNHGHEGEETAPGQQPASTEPTTAPTTSASIATGSNDQPAATAGHSPARESVPPEAQHYDGQAQHHDGQAQHHGSAAQHDTGSTPGGTPNYGKRLDKTTLTALITLWLALICLIASWITMHFGNPQETHTWHIVLNIAYWVLWVIAAISSAAALLFARLREKLAAFVLLTIIAVDLAYLLLPISTSGNLVIYQVLRMFIDVDLLVAATYIASRRPRAPRG